MKTLEATTIFKVPKVSQLVSNFEKKRQKKLMKNVCRVSIFFSCSSKQTVFNARFIFNFS